jgi:hypothetical protein
MEQRAMKISDGDDSGHRFDYSLADWLRFRPFLAGYKQLLLEVSDFAHVRRHAANRGDLENIVASLTGRRALVTVAFNDPTVVQWQIVLVRRYVPGVHVIADNSTDEESAANIERVCRTLNVPYLRLPTAKTRHASCSHGYALNWLWRNVVRPGEPEAFGFLDHDLFPTSFDDPFAPLKSQPFYGAVRIYNASRCRPARWNLWPGFCFFSFDAVRRLSLNFHQDWFFSMDSGGRNWRLLYQKTDVSKLQRPEWTSSAVRVGGQIKDVSVQWIGTWLHEVGTGPLPVRHIRRTFVKSLLCPHLLSSS